jgi:hypothetical protein
MANIPEGVIVMWPGSLASKPAGWDVVTSFYSRFPKGTAASTNPGATTGGSASHTHTADTHSHTGPNHNHDWVLPASTYPGVGVEVTIPGQTKLWTLSINHHHGTSTTSSVTATSSAAVAGSWNTISPEVPFYDMIKIESDGTPEGFPDDSVVLYNSGSAPTDWAQHAASVGDYPSTPAACGSGGANGGGAHAHSPTASHGHAAGATHDHGTATSNSECEPNPIVDGVCGNCYTKYRYHTHPSVFTVGAAGAAQCQTSPGTGSVSYEPTYRKYLGIQNTSGTDNWLEDAICMWLGNLDAIPDGWTLVTDMIGKFARFAASGGGDNNQTCGTCGHVHGTAATHTHAAASHTHAFAATPNGYTDNATNVGTQMNYNFWYYFMRSHPHGGGTSSGDTDPYGAAAQDSNTNSDTQPLFKTVAFIRAPEEPAGGGFGFHGANF